MDPSIPSLLSRADQGDSAAAAALFTTLYRELHRMARRELARRGSGMSLGVTTLLHEAYLQMGDLGGPLFADRARFMAYAARVMRGLIIDHARNRNASKRGGQFHITSLSTDIAEHLADAVELSQVSDALDALASVDPSLVEVVDLKYFCGFSFAEIAAIAHVSERTVQRRWEKARLFLYEALRGASL